MNMKDYILKRFYREIEVKNLDVFKIIGDVKIIVGNLEE